MSHKLLRLPAVIKRVGMSRSSVYRKIQEGSFPAPIKISERLNGWPESAIDDWIAEKIRQAA